MATAGASDLAVFLSVAGDVAPTFKEHIRFAIRLYNPAAPVKTIERGAPAASAWWRSKLPAWCEPPAQHVSG